MSVADRRSDARADERPLLLVLGTSQLVSRLRTIGEGLTVPPSVRPANA